MLGPMDVSVETATPGIDEVLRDVLDSVEDAALLVSEAGDICYGNFAATELLKLRSSDLLARKVWQLAVSPWRDARTWGVATADLRDGRVRRGSGLLRRPGGETLEVDLSLRLSQSRWIILTARDATPRLEATKQVQAAEKQLESILDSIADAVIITDLSGRVQKMNRVAEQLTGYSREAAFGHRLKSIVRIFEDEKPANIVRAVVDSGVVVVFGDRARLQTRDERHVSVEGVAGPIRDESGSTTGVAVVFRDWTHERRAQDALKRSEASFRSLSEGLPVALWVTRDERVVYANPAALALNQVDALEAIQGSRLVHLIHEADQAAFLQHLRDETPDFRETRVLRRDDSVAYAELASMPLIFNGKPGVVTIGRDLTERRALEAQLRVSERMVSVGTLAAGVAHEINNPLAYVLANLEQAQQSLDGLSGRVETSLLEELRDLVGEGFQGADRVRRIVRDLGTFSRSDDDVVTLVDVTQALESAIAMAQNEIRHRAMLTRDFAKELPMVSANEARLAQVFLNLLMNAAQALDDGRAETNEIRVRTRHRGDEIIVEVSDTGPGIPSELRQRIFDPFFTTKPIGEGVGLGLSICHSIVNAYAGHVSIVDEGEGEASRRWGSTFRVHLPASRALPKPAELPPPSLSKTRAARVLIVDDEPVVLKALKRILKQHEVELAHSGKQALARLLDKQERFDVIVCDMMMPEVSGLEVYQRLDAEAPDLAVRMVFMTGGAFTPAAREFLAEHKDRWLEKPFDRQRVLELIQEVLFETVEEDTSRRHEGLTPPG
ncbi:MAG: PAS domain S-box protein [Polyangiaceae bacterium]